MFTVEIKYCPESKRFSGFIDHWHSTYCRLRGEVVAITPREIKAQNEQYTLVDIITDYLEAEQKSNNFIQFLNYHVVQIPLMGDGSILPKQIRDNLRTLWIYYHSLGSFSTVAWINYTWVTSSREG